MKGKDATGPDVSDDDLQTLRQALRQLPTPEPRAGFVERALARAAAQSREEQAVSLPGRLRNFAMRWETWAGAALGGAVAAALTFVLLRTVDMPAVSPQPQLALTLHEARNVDVLIDSERALKGATIRVVASGSIVLDGFEDESHVDWQADLERGSNLLSLPVVARAAGKGRLVAVIEYEGRTQRVAVELTVLDPKVSQS
jgi:hypothetical protein